MSQYSKEVTESTKRRNARLSLESASPGETISVPLARGHDTSCACFLPTDPAA